MSLLRLYCPLTEPPERCRWALVNPGRETVSGEGAIADLPRHAERVQMLIPAAQVLFARTRLPPSAGRRAGPALAYAVEEQTLGEPGHDLVRWLGVDAGEDVLAVFAKAGFDAWQAALAAAGIVAFDVQCETLLLPLAADAWSLSWTGVDGFIRSGGVTGAAIDHGSASAPPVMLQMLLAEARAAGNAPSALVLHATTSAALPDLAAWSRELQLEVRAGAPCDWRTAAVDAGVSLGLERRRWQWPGGLGRRLRPAAWLVGAALALHALALVGEWGVLTHQQAALRADMEATFRAAFPDAVAVADPALQMRRKLAEARHAAGQGDAGDFLAMIGPFAEAARALPAGSVRSLAHDGGRLQVELAGLDAAALQALTRPLREAGLVVDPIPDAPAGTPVLLTVRAP